MRELLDFDKFLTPYLVKFVYWVGLLAIVIFAASILISIVVGNGGFANLVLSVCVLFFGIVIWRITCEGIMLAFKTFDRLSEIRDHVSRR